MNSPEELTTYQEQINAEQEYRQKYLDEAEKWAYEAIGVG